jgi:hypothetical protein
MPKKPNYDFEKRQKEIARKQKQEEKRSRKRTDAELPDGSAEPAPESLPLPAKE